MTIAARGAETFAQYKGGDATRRGEGPNGGPSNQSGERPDGSQRRSGSYGGRR